MNGKELQTGKVPNGGAHHINDQDHLILGPLVDTGDQSNTCVLKHHDPIILLAY